MQTTDERAAPTGLTSAEADLRRRRGEANTAPKRASRTSAQILRTNVFSFYNSILFFIGIVLLALGRYNDALVSVGLGLINAVLSSIQELRAKRKLDRLQLLDQTTVTVVRDGRDVPVPPEHVVRGDVVHVRTGDQVVVDGPLVAGPTDRLEADESLLTGESDPVVKRPGDELPSGSWCSGGEGYQLATGVGADAHAHKLTTEARIPTVDKTPLQRRMEFTRDVADIVLVDDSFAALLPAQREGRKIINGIATSMYVFLTRVATQTLVILAVTLLGLGFPYEPTQVGLTLLTVGVPTFLLTMWAPATRPEPDLLASLARFVIPASVITAGFATAVYSFHSLSLSTGLADPAVPAFVITEFEGYTGLPSTDPGFIDAAATLGAQTALSTFITFASFALLLFLFPPHRLFAAWTRPITDHKPTIMVALLTAAFFVVLYTPALSDYFGITDPAGPIWTTVVPGLLLWFLALTAAFRWRLMDRILGLDDLPRSDAARR